MCELILEAKIHRRQFREDRAIAKDRSPPTALRFTKAWLSFSSALQQIHRLADNMSPKMFLQRRMLCCDSFVHGIGHIAIGRMAGGRGAQLGNVNGLGEIHLEQRALAKSQRNRILRALRRFIAARCGKLLNSAGGSLHCGFIVGAYARGCNFRWRIEAVNGREILHDLHAAAMPVQVAEAADVHENVKAKLLAGGKGAQQLVVLAAMPQAKIEDLATPRLASRRDRAAYLTVRIVTVPVDERCR